MVDWCIISHHIACYLTSNNIMLYHIISHHIILYLCACLSVCLCACLSVCLSICLSVYFSVSRSICLRVSVCLCAYLCIYLSLAFLPLYLSSHTLYLPWTTGGLWVDCLHLADQQNQNDNPHRWKMKRNKKGRDEK